MTVWLYLFSMSVLFMGELLMVLDAAKPSGIAGAVVALGISGIAAMLVLLLVLYLDLEDIRQQIDELGSRSDG